jgi:hypothetical protein
MNITVYDSNNICRWCYNGVRTLILFGKALQFFQKNVPWMVLYRECSTDDSVQGMFHRECSTENVLQMIPYRECSTGNVPQGMFHGECYTDDSVQGMFHRECSTGNVPRRMLYRWFRTGNVPHGMLYRWFRTGNVPHGMLYRWFRTGNVPHGMFLHLRYIAHTYIKEYVRLFVHFLVMSTIWINRKYIAYLAACVQLISRYPTHFPNVIYSYDYWKNKILFLILAKDSIEYYILRISNLGKTTKKWITFTKNLRSRRI